MNIKTEKLFNYDCEKLDRESEEFKILKEVFFTTTTFNVSCNNLEKFQIYKVIENNPTKTVEGKSSNLMLFHGTTEEGATGILKKGFKNSEKGWFGK